MEIYYKLDKRNMARLFRLWQDTPGSELAPRDGHTITVSLHVPFQDTPFLTYLACAKVVCSSCQSV